MSEPVGVVTGNDEPLLLTDVVETSAAVASERGRRRKREIIAALLERAGEAMPIVVGFLVGEPRQGRIGVGPAAVHAVQVPTLVHPELSVVDVDRVIDALATTSGPGSVAGRASLLESIFSRATADEQEFLRALFTGGLRQGALEGVMADAIAEAAGVPSAAVRRAAMFSGDLGRVASIALAEGEGGLAEVGLELLRPVLPMLAATSETVSEAVIAMGTTHIEWKLDGVRIQVHRAGDRVEVFTRNLNRVTDRLPRIVSTVRALDVETVILDGEAMSLSDDGAARSFEQTMSRFGAEADGDAESLVPFFFDVLHLDGRDLIDAPLRDRRRILEDLVDALAVPMVVTSDPAVAEAFAREVAEAGHEGVVVKDPGSTYEAGRRGSAWRKVKPTHTLDLLVLAAEWGHGRRTGWLSNLHLGALDPDTGDFVMLGKTFKGLTDAMLEEQTARLLELEERRSRNTVWVRPGLVVEVAFDGVLPSPRYPGGMALRFARVKAHRHDKRPDEVDTIDTVRAIFQGRG